MTPRLTLVALALASPVEAAFRSPFSMTPRGANAKPPQSLTSDKWKLFVGPTASDSLDKFHAPNPALAALPVASYAALGGVGFAALKLASGSAAWLVGGSVALPITVLLAQLLTLGGAGIAKSMGGEPASPRIVALAEEAASAVNIKAPTHVYMIEKNEPNAFAASGLLGGSTTVAVTRGLSDILSDSEMKAVLAHEMGHLRYNDAPRNMHIAIATAGLGGVYEAGRVLLDVSSRSERKKSKDDDSKSSTAGIGLTLMAAGLGSQAVAHLLRLGASRTAELRADRAAAAAFGADSLVNALRKIDQNAARFSDLRETAGGRAMGFSMISDGASPKPSPAKASDDGRGWLAKPERALAAIGGLMRTHPRLDERIASLEALVESGEVPKHARR